MNKKAVVRKARLALLLAAGAAIVAGCMGAGGESRYVTLDVPAERLRTIDTLDLKEMSVPEAAAPGAPTPLAEGISSTEAMLTLEECRAIALENNLELKVVLVEPTISAENVTQEEARFESSLFSNLRYAITDTPTASALESSQTKLTSGELGVNIPLRTGGMITFDVPTSKFTTSSAFATLPTSYGSTFSASITQPLLRGAWDKYNTYGIRIARYGRQIGEAQTKLEVMRIIAAIDKVYWQLYAAQRELEVRRNEYDLAVAQLERAKRLVQAGKSTEVEIVRAETGVAEKLESIILAENVARLRERDLKRALGKPGLGMETPTAVTPLTKPDPVHYNLDRAMLVKGAFDNRMELLELELQIAADARTIDIRRSEVLPSLALGYTYTVNGLGTTFGDSLDQLNEKRFEDHSVSLGLSIPLGNAAARSRLRQAIARRVQRLATRESRRAEIQQEVLNAVDQIDTNWQRVLANRQRTILAARNLEAETRQFELGLRTSTDVLEAQTRLGNAQSAEISSLVEYQIAQVDLAYATGTLLGAARVEWAPGASGIAAK